MGQGFWTSWFRSSCPGLDVDPMVEVAMKPLPCFPSAHRTTEGGRLHPQATTHQNLVNLSWPHSDSSTTNCYRTTKTQETCTIPWMG